MFFLLFRSPGGSWEIVRDPWDLRASERAALHPYSPSHPAFIDITDMDAVVEPDGQPPVVDLTEDEGGVNVGASGSGVGRGGSAGRGGRGRGGRDGGGGRGGSAPGGDGQGGSRGGGASV